MKRKKINKNGQEIHMTVSALFFNKNNEMLIIKKADPAYSKKYSVVAGHIEEGETIEDALLREVSEEISLNISEYELIAEFENLNDSCRYGASLHDWYVFKINHKIDINKINFDKKEIISLHWMNKEEMKKNKDFFTSGSKSMLSALNMF